MLSFRHLLMEWRHFYHQVTWITEQTLFFMGFSLSRKNNFIVKAVAFFFFSAEKKTQYIYKYNNKFLWCILNLPKRNFTNGERGYVVFRYWWARKQFFSCGNFKTSLSLGHSNVVFCSDWKLEMPLYFFPLQPVGSSCVSISDYCQSLSYIPSLKNLALSLAFS